MSVLVSWLYLVCEKCKELCIYDMRTCALVVGVSLSILAYWAGGGLLAYLLGYSGLQLSNRRAQIRYMCPFL